MGIPTSTYDLNLDSLTVLDDSSYVVAASVDQYPAITAYAYAITWCSGSSDQGGCTGVIGRHNSVVDFPANQVIYSFNVLPLTGGRYVIQSAYAENGSGWGRDWMTWCPAGGCRGALDPAHTLTTSDTYSQLFALTNGNFVVKDRYSITWCSGQSGCPTSAALNNSLMSRSKQYELGVVGTASRFRAKPLDWYGVVALEDGNFLVLSTRSQWDDRSKLAMATPADGVTGRTSGYVSSANSLLGSQIYTRSQDDPTLIVDYDAARGRLVVGFPEEKRVAVFSGIVKTSATYLPLVRNENDGRTLFIEPSKIDRLEP